MANSKQPRPKDKAEKMQTVNLGWNKKDERKKKNTKLRPKRGEKETPT